LWEIEFNLGVMARDRQTFPEKSMFGFFSMLPGWLVARNVVVNSLGPLFILYWYDLKAQVAQRREHIAKYKSHTFS
jgi:hypothetical protein